ncbi:MAG: response regulator [Burkholderiales bacterium]|nr:response regulator [Anaerolineae bacterium]
MSSKILIADDEAFIRQLIMQTLEPLEDDGAEILTADNGETALQLIQSERPALVFMDVMMPRMNGFDVCHTVKRELQLSDVFIVILTAKGQEIDRVRGEEVGADVYMTKPFDPDELLELAERVLKA